VDAAPVTGSELGRAAAVVAGVSVAGAAVVVGVGSPITMGSTIGSVDGGWLEGGADVGGWLDGGVDVGGAVDGGVLDGGVEDGGVDEGGVLDGGVDEGGVEEGGVLVGGSLDGGVLVGGSVDGGVDDGGVDVDPLLPHGPWLRLKLPTVVPSGTSTEAPVTVTPSPRWAVVR
jgi:hypothetical protein